MFFKNAIQYLTTQELPDLQQRKFRNPTPKELSYTGFTPVEDDLYVVNGLFCLRHAEKIIPASAVKYRVEQLAAGRKVPKDELIAMKESVIREAAVHALVKVTDTYAYLGGGKLIVNTASHNTAERVVSHLRALSGTFAVEKMPAVDVHKVVFTPMAFAICGKVTLLNGDDKINFTGENADNFISESHFSDIEKVTLMLRDTTFAIDKQFVLSNIKMVEKPEDLRTDIAWSIGVINEITETLNETLHNL